MTFRRSYSDAFALYGLVSALLVVPAHCASAVDSCVMAGCEVRARLMAPLSTGSSRPGDVVAARVISPPELQGAFLEGEVRELQERSGKRPSLIEIQIHTLHSAGSEIPVSASLIGIANGRKQANRDDAGAPVEGDSTDVRSRGHGIFLATKRHVRAAPTIRIVTQSPSLSLGVGAELMLQIEARK